MRNKLTEKYLLYQIQVKKSPESFGTLYDEYVEKIYRFVYLKLSSKEEAEDITSEVFLKTWNYLIERPQENITSFSGLVYKIARNAVIDVYRQRARHKTTTMESMDEFPADATYIDAVHMNQEIQALLRQIKKMKNEYQEVLVLRYIDDLPTKEIAEILGKSPSNVRVTLHRALKVLKKLSESHE
jgi:RNA polymerase sigma-70 factor, ECF subfamily